MSALTLNPPTIQRPAFGRIFQDEPVFAGTALVLTILMVPTLMAMGLDAREFQMQSVWVKPMKFLVALAVYMATLAVYARWLPQAMRASRTYHIYTWVVVAAIAGEMVWIGGAAALGTASHFNDGTPLLFWLYNLMGVLAVILTTASAVYGVAIWRNRASGLSDGMRTALGLGLVLTLPLTLVTAGFLSGYGGHFVGTPVTNATLPLMGWSTEVGDLRVGHFFSTHALHIVPLAALVLAATPRMAWLIGGGFTVFTLATFAQAVAGLPFIAL